jgi:hypothetical protein
MHRLLLDRVAGRWKGRSVKRADCYQVDAKIALSLPIKGAAAIRAEMKSNAIAAGRAYGDGTEIARPAAAVASIQTGY